jgi:hypothetical protein
MTGTRGRTSSSIPFVITVSIAAERTQNRASLSAPFLIAASDATASTSSPFPLPLRGHETEHRCPRHSSSLLPMPLRRRKTERRHPCRSSSPLQQRLTPPSHSTYNDNAIAVVALPSLKREDYRHERHRHQPTTNLTFTTANIYNSNSVKYK